ncbi:hypothetical protein J6590_041807, partial [Homalodisca vitripennis]
NDCRGCPTRTACACWSSGVRAIRQRTSHSIVATKPEVRFHSLPQSGIVPDRCRTKETATEPTHTPSVFSGALAKIKTYLTALTRIHSEVVAICAQSHKSSFNFHCCYCIEFTPPSQQN